MHRKFWQLTFADGQLIQLVDFKKKKIALKLWSLKKNWHTVLIGGKTFYSALIKKYNTNEIDHVANCSLIWTMSTRRPKLSWSNPSHALIKKIAYYIRKHSLFAGIEMKD